MPLFEEGAYEYLFWPGQAMTWRAFRDLRNSRGQPVPSGEYRIRGALSGSVCGRACPPDLDSNLHADIQRTIIPPHVLEVLP
jgi:hypothetical protein